jgi:hypothetical protein
VIAHRIAVVLVAVLSWATPASAQVDAMRADMHHYFDGEAAEAWVFLGVGAIALGGATYGIGFGGDPYLEGAAWPVGIVGLIQIAAGLVLLARTPGQVDDLDAQLDTDPAAYRTGELTRMTTVNDQFDLLAIVEVGLIVAGAGFATWGFLDDEPFAAGLGLGLAAQAAIMLVLDLFAAARADTYTAALDAFTP